MRRYVLIISAAMIFWGCNSSNEAQTKEVPQEATDTTKILESTLEIFDVEEMTREVVYKAAEHFEAPNWSRDGSFLIFNQEGKLYKIPVTGGVPEEISTDFAVDCNNDHGISPDGNALVISHHEESTHQSIIYTLPIEGGTPKQITPKGPSYWHGWSPDGHTLAYCAEREGEFDIYTISLDGGEEVRLTNAEGLDDGPDYTYDGRYIYYNSVRSGKMKIWRMKADGTEQEQVTFDEFNDWFAHPSPNGQWIVFVSYESDVEGHPANKNVKLRMMPIGGGDIIELCDLFGGQGTINVPSWSPDSKQFAFVSYQLL